MGSAAAANPRRGKRLLQGDAGGPEARRHALRGGDGVRDDSWGSARAPRPQTRWSASGTSSAAVPCTGSPGVPTSLKTKAHAARVGIPMLALADAAEIHLSIDGADKVGLELNLVKGRGGSLLHEKMIEGVGGRIVVIVDEPK